MSTTIIPPGPGPNTPPQTATPVSSSQTRPAARPPGETLAGAVVPGAALTALISLAWLSHQFGLKVLLAALIATALAAAAGAAVIARAAGGRRTRRTARANTGRAGPISRMLGRGGASGPLGAGRTPTIPQAARRPAGMGPGSGLKGPSRASRTHLGSVAHGTTGGHVAGRQSTAQPHRVGQGFLPPVHRTHNNSQTGRSPLGGPKNGPGSGLNTTRPNRRGTGATGPAGAGALLGAKDSTKSRPTTPGQRAGKPGQAPGRTGLLKGRQARKAAKAQATAAGLGAAAQTKGLNKSGQPIKPKTGPLPVKPAGKLRRGAQWLKKRTAPQMSALKTKAGQHAAVVRLKAPAAAKAGRTMLKAGRRSASWLSKAAAYGVKHGGRWTMAAHLGLKRARLGGMGPNWWPALARVMSWCTTPAAWLVSKSYGWSWLQTWVFVRTGGARAPIPLNTGLGRTPRTAAGHGPTSAPADRRATIPTMRGASMSDAAPLQQAAETIRTAFATVAVNPAENMVGFEAVVTSIPELFDALTDGLSTLSTVFEEAFKVNEAIPDAYRDAATYTKGLSDHVQAIHQMYRALHEEQIENIENPTEQAAKWDVDRNRLN